MWRKWRGRRSTTGTACRPAQPTTSNVPSETTEAARPIRQHRLDPLSGQPGIDRNVGGTRLEDPEQARDQAVGARHKEPYRPTLRGALKAKAHTSRDLVGTRVEFGVDVTLDWSTRTAGALTEAGDRRRESLEEINGLAHATSRPRGSPPSASRW